jgi:predicted RNase H-like HicB family nuclease
VRNLRYTAVFEPAPEGGFIVTVPALGGLTTQGETLEEARTMVKEAILGYLEALTKAGDDIPIETGPAQVESVAVNF